VQSYEEAFAKIQAATGITDIDELVNTFIEAEDQNFSLFNYVNELNSEVEKLEEQIAEIRSEIEKYRGQGVNTDNQRKKILKVRGGGV
jgi:coiled-coil domain-containing protein 63/114